MTSTELALLCECKEWCDQQLVHNASRFEDAIRSLRFERSERLVAQFSEPKSQSNMIDFRAVCNARRDIVADIITARRSLHKKYGPAGSSRPPGRQNLVVRFPSMCDLDAQSFVASNGFFDEEDLPPSGTWALLFDRTDEVGFSSYAFEFGGDISAFCLLAYAPDPLKNIISRGIRENLVGSVVWLDRFCDTKPDSVLAKAVHEAGI